MAVIGRGGEFRAMGKAGGSEPIGQEPGFQGGMGFTTPMEFVISGFEALVAGSVLG